MESRYRHPVTLALAEKIFGPSLNGKGAPGNTLSALATPGNKGKTYIGVPGIEPDAVFCIRFPREIDLSRLPRTSGKPGVPDHVRGLKKDGPFAGQNRESEIKRWEENQKELERFAAALPEIAKRAQVAGELNLPGIGKLKVKVRVLSGRGSKVVCEPVG
ncbi:MAG: hypothetical protein JOZ08_23395 [Verrucomicrobia bacterium]|nr:hypothetical protein [Verrucomicrobiota bacterium]MBV8274446.1 hypothetical protein [Verrucomicrobiota bacterium]